MQEDRFLNRNDKNNEPGRNPGVGENGEYRIVRPEQARQSYSDAGYIPQSEAPSIRRRRYSAAEKKAEKPRGGVHASTVVALCVICALLGGVAGGLTGGYFAGRTPAEGSLAPTVSDTQQPQQPVVQQPTVWEPVAASDAAALGSVGSAIYALGCPQTVGVTTEVTTRNIFGQVSTSSVSGSGFIISEDGYILTNYHVIQTAHLGGHDISVMLHNGERYPAEIVGYESEGTDVAVLKIEAQGLSPVTTGSSEDVQVGEPVFAIGNPLGELVYTMTTGFVSALDREIVSQDSYTGATETVNFFQFDAAVNEGNSGGPLYNARGEVIGIVTAKYSSAGVEGLGFALPIDEAVGIAAELIEKGYVSGKAVLGIAGETVSEGVARYYDMVQGVYVWSVEKGSGAAKAGLRAGDIITALGDTAVHSTSELNVAERGYRAGDTGYLTVYRDGAYLEVEVVFDEDVPE